MHYVFNEYFESKNCTILGESIGITVSLTNIQQVRTTCISPKQNR